MGFAQGRFGIEYDPRKMEREPSGLRWVFVLVAVVAFVSLAWTLAGRFLSRDETPPDMPPEPPPKAASSNEASVASSAPPPPIAKPIVDTSAGMRPQNVKNLIMRLAEAEKRRDVEMAVTTIEQIRALPGSPAADLDDSLARRLGALNLRRLFVLKSAQWVKEVEVKRGDVASRIAFENGSTLASLAKLNGGDVNKVVIGRKLYVMDHPRFSLVVHRRTRTADLSLNGKFFKRYDIQDEISGKEGAYEFPANPKAFWRSLGIEFRLDDRAELEMLMPAKATVLVAEL